MLSLVYALLPTVYALSAIGKAKRGGNCLNSGFKQPFRAKIRTFLTIPTTQILPCLDSSTKITEITLSCFVHFETSFHSVSARKTPLWNDFLGDITPVSNFGCVRGWAAILTRDRCDHNAGIFLTWLPCWSSKVLSWKYTGSVSPKVRAVGFDQKAINKAIVKK